MRMDIITATTLETFPRAGVCPKGTLHELFVQYARHMDFDSMDLGVACARSACNTLATFSPVNASGLGDVLVDAIDAAQAEEDVAQSSLILGDACSSMEKMLEDAVGTVTMRSQSNIDAGPLIYHGFSGSRPNDATHDSVVSLASVLRTLVEQARVHNARRTADASDLHGERACVGARLAACAAMATFFATAQELSTLDATDVDQASAYESALKEAVHTRTTLTTEISVGKTTATPMMRHETAHFERVVASMANLRIQACSRACKYDPHMPYPSPSVEDFDTIM